MNLNEYKCLRIFSVLDMHKRKKTLLVLLIINAIAIGSMLYNDKPYSWAPAFVASTVWCFFMSVMEAPKKLSVGSKYIEFSETQFLSPRHVHVTIHGMSLFYPAKVNYSVSEVRDVELRQSSLEKLFNVGRISFSGDVRAESKRDLDRIDIKQTFLIYGITDFDRFRKEFEA